MLVFKIRIWQLIGMAMTTYRFRSITFRLPLPTGGCKLEGTSCFRVLDFQAVRRVEMRSVLQRGRTEDCLQFLARPSGRE